jgi:ATP-dependent helicase HrpB
VIDLACSGRTSLEDLRDVPLRPLLEARLSHDQRRILEREAPESLVVPSGRRIRIQYEPGRPPILSVRLQELFGWRETPRIARGRVPLLLQLLGPNHRPVQITTDLQSFWNTAYHQVRKDLRARYPRHAWPEDPWTAQAKGGLRRG